MNWTMYKLCLLVACLARASTGRRLFQTALLHQSFNGQDVKGQNLSEQMSTSAGSMSHSHAKRSESRQFTKSLFDPWGKAVANSRIPGKTVLASAQDPVWRNPTGDHDGPRATMTDSQIHGNTGVASNNWIDTPILRKPIAARRGVRVVMMGQEAPIEFGEPTVRIAVSVDWEGNDLRKENLHAFENFHETHPEVPLTHFLNAAYFTNTQDQFVNEWSPREALRPTDEIGLHIHGLKSLVESSGVQYRSQPSIYFTPEQMAEEAAVREIMREEIDKMTKVPEWLKATRALVDPKSAAKVDKLCDELKIYLSNDVGWHVDISAYSVDEMRAIVSNSKAILEGQGLPVGKSFRAGAWLAAPNVLEAIRHEGFSVNSSAVGFDELIAEQNRNISSGVFNWSYVLRAPWDDKPLPERIREIWPGITGESQPFVVETPAGRILEMPDTGGLADYATVEAMVANVDKAVQQLDSEDRFVHLGFHQETAADFAPRVVAAITEIQRKHGHRVVFETLEASAQHALSSERLKNEPKTKHP